MRNAMTTSSIFKKVKLDLKSLKLRAQRIRAVRVGRGRKATSTAFGSQTHSRRPLTVARNGTDASRPRRLEGFAFALRTVTFYGTLFNDQHPKNFYPSYVKSPTPF